MRMLRQICFVVTCFILLINNSFAQTANSSLVKADKFYDSGNYYLAEENYRKARENEKELKSTFNLGNAVYQQERYAEAIDHYTAAAQLAPDNTKRSDAYYNLGNALFQNAQEEQAMEPLQESIDAFKEAIQLNPSNQEAKYNLLVAKKVLRSAQEQEQQQQQQQNQDQEQQDQENQENQDQEQQDQQQQDQENQDQENQENQEQQDGQEQQDSTNQNQDIQENAAFDTTRLDKQTLDSLDAMKLLQVIENEEKKVQEKLKKFNSNRKKPDKDW